MAPRRHEAAAFRGSRVTPRHLPEPDDIHGRGTRARGALLSAGRNAASPSSWSRRDFMKPLRHLDNSAIPGDPPCDGRCRMTTFTAITRRSAVLVAFFEEGGETHLVLTRRSFSMREHRGEIALPGGRSDPDETPTDTALREAREEVGIDQSTVRVVGWLSPIVTFTLRSAIWPVVGFLRDARPWRPIPPRSTGRSPCHSPNSSPTVPSSKNDGGENGLVPVTEADGLLPDLPLPSPRRPHLGATARVVTELLCVVTGVDWPEARGRGRKSVK